MGRVLWRRVASAGGKGWSKVGWEDGTKVGLDSEVGSPSRENLARLEEGAGLEHKLGVVVGSNEGEDSA